MYFLCFFLALSFLYFFFSSFINVCLFVPIMACFCFILILLMPVYFLMRDRKKEYEFQWVGKCKDMGRIEGGIMYVCIILN